MPYSIGQVLEPGHDVATGQAPGKQAFSYGRVGPGAPAKIIGIRNVGGETYLDISQTDIGGGTGWLRAMDLETSRPEVKVSAPAPSPSAPRISSPTLTSSVGQQLLNVPSALDFARQQEEMERRRREELLTPYRENLSRYVAAIQGLQNPLDIYRGLETQLGIPQLRETTAGLRGQIKETEDLIRQIEPDVSARSRESILTEAQRRRLVASEQEKPRQQLTDLVRGLEVETGNLRDLTGQLGTQTQFAVAGQEQQLRPFQEQLSAQEKIMDVETRALADRLSREMTGFTADRQTQLDILLNRLAREEVLSDREWEQAQKLSQEEREWTRTKEEIELRAATEAKYRKPEVKKTELQEAQALAKDMAPSTGWDWTKANQWITAWNTIKNRYPQLSNADIDSLLGVPGGFTQVVQMQPAPTFKATEPGGGDDNPIF